MADFKFLQSSITKKWVILDPRRSKRPNVGNKAEPICPFCIGCEVAEQELYRMGGEEGDCNWHIRVIKNKFPFAPIHEIIIHSPDHHKNFEELPIPHIELILQTYRARYLENKPHGQVYIFHNRGIGGGESLPHPHTQLVVIPNNISHDIPSLDLSIYNPCHSERSVSGVEESPAIKLLSSMISPHSSADSVGMIMHNMREFLTSLVSKKRDIKEASTIEFVETENFSIFCPLTSQMPDEVWVVPIRKGMYFGDISDKEITDLAFILSRLINIFDLRHGHEFPFNFYVYPGKNWYLRIIPRIKILGGFEMGTGIVVNTQDPGETFAFIKEHFFEPNLEKIREEQQEDYWKSV